MGINYYDLPYASYSTFKDLSDNLLGKEKPAHIQQIYDFGNLVDSMITEPDTLVPILRTMKQEGGRRVKFSKEDWSRAKDMHKSFVDSELGADLMKICTPQYIYIRKFPYHWKGQNFKIKTRCKFDLHRKPNIGSDIKTTVCQTLRAFRSSISFFDYDMQCALYMDMAKANQYSIIGISTIHPHPVFIHTVKRGDKLYNQGKSKYNYWAYKYYSLIEQFAA